MKTKRPLDMSAAAYRVDDLAEALGQTIGQSQARSLIRQIAGSLGMASSMLKPHEADAVLAKLAAMPGFVGVAAQMARTRLRLAALQRSLQRPSDP
jgi:hypothetical protein